MARMTQVMIRLRPEKVDVLEQIGQERQIVIAAGPKAGQVNVSEVIRVLIAEADERLAD